MDEKKKKHWLIIAAIVACAVLGGLVLLGVVAGVAIPAWMSSVRASKEAEAVATLNQIAAEERIYYNEHGSYASFDRLIEAGQLDKRFAGELTTVAKGYVITHTVTPRGSREPTAFTVNADPQRGEGISATGRRHFYMDSTSGDIHYSEERSATADDPVLESRKRHTSISFVSRINHVSHPVGY